MRVEPATPQHLRAARAVYASARATQREQESTVWPVFTDESILAQAEAGQLFRVMDGDALVGLFTVAYDDEAIWGELERGEHIYLHRIARAASYSGRGLVDAILDWARAHCRAVGRTGLRMDTWANNATLIDFYEAKGFRVIARRRMGDDPRLPHHYRGNEFALLEEPRGWRS